MSQAISTSYQLKLEMSSLVFEVTRLHLDASVAYREWLSYLGFKFGTMREIVWQAQLREIPVDRAMKDRIYECWSFVKSRVARSGSLDGLMLTRREEIMAQELRPPVNDEAENLFIRYYAKTKYSPGKPWFKLRIRTIDPYEHYRPEFLVR